MRAAPPVSVQATGGLGWRWVRSLLPALAAASLVTWLVGHAAPQASAAVSTIAAACAALVVGALAWRLYLPQSVTLCWDGQCWSADGTAGRLEVAMDLGGWLLLRLDPVSGATPRWIAVAATEVGGALHGLRAAVYSRPAAPTPSRSADGESLRSNV